MKTKTIKWNDTIMIELKEESEGLGLIIDVFNAKTKEHIDSMTIWYDDLTRDNN